MRKTYTGFDKVRTVRQNPLSAQGFNPYAYCMYNPLRYVDPTGWAPRPGGGNGPDNPPYVVIDGWTSGFMLPEVTVTPYEERPTTFTEFVYTPYSGGGGGRESNYGNPNDTPTFSQGGGSGGGGGNHGSTSNPSPNNADNIDIASKVLITTNLYTTIESSLYYNRLTRTWRDKLDVIRSFEFHGNQYTGGIFKYGKLMSNKYLYASGWLNGIGIGLSTIQMVSADNIDDQIKYGSDLFYGLIGFAPGGSMISSFWFFGGRSLVFHYGETMGVLIENGINPGYPVYQPFK